MILHWVLDQNTKLLNCIINENLKYTSRNGGRTFVKTFNGEETPILSDDEWEAEKHWISDNFSDLVGVYSPKPDITEESWQASNPTWVGAIPLFGTSDDGLYLDKLARTSFVQEGRDMTTVYMSGKMQIEQDENGDYWQRPYCDEQDIFYNCQPCCVFPHNPGRQKMDSTVAEKYINGEMQ